MGRTLYFEQITDSRFEPMEQCLEILQKRAEKIKELLTMKDVFVSVDNPYFIDWTPEMKIHYEKLAIEFPHDKEYFLAKSKEQQIQYRVKFYIQKNTRKVTWGDIMEKVNSVKAVRYSFLSIKREIIC